MFQTIVDRERRRERERVTTNERILCAFAKFSARIRDSDNDRITREAFVLSEN